MNNVFPFRLFRLVKFESTKSLASTSSRSLGGALSDNGDRDAALQNVLTFIAEQQKYVHGIEGGNSRPCSVNDVTKEFNIEAPPQEIDELKICECNTGDVYISNKSNSELYSKNDEDENYVTLKQLCTEFNLNEQNAMKDTDFKKVENLKEDVLQTVAYADEICMVTPIDLESENCSNISEHPVDICSSVSVELTSTDYQCSVLDTTSDQTDNSKKCMELSDISSTSDLIKSSDTVSSDSPNNGMSESLTSSNSTPDTIVSKIPRRKYMPSKIPVSPAKTNTQTTSTTTTNTNTTINNNNNDQEHNTSKLPKSKIPHKNSKISRPKGANQKQKVVHVQSPQPQHVITAERTPPVASGVISNIIDGPPHRAVSFHERATSKDVIDELNRMIKNGDDTVQETTEAEGQVKLDEACRATGWVHVEQEIDLTDPKVNGCMYLSLFLFCLTHRSHLNSKFRSLIFIMFMFAASTI